MKNKISHLVLLVIAAIAMPLSSCKKYLDLAPTSTFDEAYVFSTVPGATSAVYGVYSAMAVIYGGGVVGLTALDNDEFVNNISNTSAADDAARYGATPQNSSVGSQFSQLYAGIERANICIKDIPKMDQYNNGSATDKAQVQRLYGEALTLRAQFYYELIVNWGDIPAPFVPAIDLPDPKLGKTDRDVIYDHILDDLKIAEDIVPWRNDAGVTVDERITKGTVKGLRARIAMQAGGYSLRKSKLMERRSDYLKYCQIARDECYGIMQRPDKHSLNPDFKSVFKDAVLSGKIESHGEVLFEVAYGAGAYGRIGYKDGNRYYIPGIATILGGGNVRCLPTYFYSYNPLDTRRDVSICTYYGNPDGTIAVQKLLDLVDGKYRTTWLTPQPTSNNQYLGTNWYLMRFSDALLLFAEAENELHNGATPDAIAAFEQVRKRGFKGNESQIGVTPTAKVDFLTAIQNERHFELGGEGIRKYDLIRWNLLGTKLVQSRADLAAMLAYTAPFNTLPKTLWYKTGTTEPIYGNSFYSPTPVGAVPAGYLAVSWLAGMTQYAGYTTNLGKYFVANHSELFPLPQAAIDGNPNLHQDYGYGN
jgi:hypothetical protein